MTDEDPDDSRDDHHHEQDEQQGDPAKDRIAESAIA